MLKHVRYNGQVPLGRKDKWVGSPEVLTRLNLTCANYGISRTSLATKEEHLDMV